MGGQSSHAVFRSHNTAVGVSISRFKQERISGVAQGASEKYLICGHGRVVKLGSLTWHRFVLASLLSLSLITIQLHNSARFTVKFLVYCYGAFIHCLGLKLVFNTQEGFVWASHIYVAFLSSSIC